jgi:hypothetical protein
MKTRKQGTVSTTPIHYINEQANKVADILQSQNIKWADTAGPSLTEWQLAANLAGISELTQAITVESCKVLYSRELAGFTVANKDKAIIVREALYMYQPEQFTVTDETSQLSDGHTAYFVKVHLDDEDYWATVVNGKAYGNVELIALRAEYAT